VDKKNTLNRSALTKCPKASMMHTTKKGMNIKKTPPGWSITHNRNTLTSTKDTSGLRKWISKSNSKKETMDKHCHPSIEDLRFSPWRIVGVSKTMSSTSSLPGSSKGQTLGFHLGNHNYSRSNTKTEDPQWCCPLDETAITIHRSLGSPVPGVQSGQEEVPQLGMPINL
jgi:hypothetical protein